MSKRRTKESKVNPNYNFLISWENKAKQAQSRQDVKRQIPDAHSRNSSSMDKIKKADISDKDNDLRLIKRNIIKSLALASLVLGIELVLYLSWY